MSGWFRPRRYGFGVTPKTWQGRLLVAINVAVIVAATWMLRPADRPLPTLDWAEWLVLVIGSTAAVAWIAYRHTDGAWRWRWGDRPGAAHGKRM